MFLLSGGSGDDHIDASGLMLRSDQPEILGITAHGGAGEDVLIGTNGKDQLRGHEGGDVLLGEGGDDELDGGLGSDHLFGDDGDDVLIGGRHLIGNTDDFAIDYLMGGAGADVFYLGILDSTLDFDQQEGDQFGL
jgi:Ca2+-binding RTX toxin-like protein